MKAIKILLSLLCLSVLFIFVYFSGFFYYTKITPCSPPPNIHPDGRVSALVFTWEDLNKDGYYGDGEPPLPNVSVIHPLTLEATSATNNEGLARTIEYKAHCPCNCWQNMFVEVQVPKGYVASTDTKRVLSGENQTLLFGFTRSN
jgi:hypothetical protein